MLAAAIGGGVLAACAARVRAGADPTAEPGADYRIAAGKAAHPLPRFDPKAGCGAPQPAGGIDVEIIPPRFVGLGTAAISQLKKLGVSLRKPEQKDAALVVTGHTDARGSEEYNHTFQSAAPRP